jgi:hypothetical protein
MLKQSFRPGEAARDGGWEDPKNNGWGSSSNDTETNNGSDSSPTARK